VNAPLTLALAYIVVTALHLTLYFHAATGDRRLRTTLRLYGTGMEIACSTRSPVNWRPLLSPGPAEQSS
jgi:hypothetical protein